MEWITNPESLIALLTLTVLEIVLGIDNIIFISILSGKLPKEQQNKARLTGLGTCNDNKNTFAVLDCLDNEINSPIVYCTRTGN